MGDENPLCAKPASFLPPGLVPENPGRGFHSDTAGFGGFRNLPGAYPDDPAGNIQPFAEPADRFRVFLPFLGVPDAVVYVKAMDRISLPALNSG
jgi:hypothetical protein